MGRRIRVRVLIRGRVGDGWLDVDRRLKLPPEATLADLIAVAESKGVPISAALEQSPHLAQTLMLNGERCPVAENRDRPLSDGDEIYLLAPIVGG